MSTVKQMLKEQGPTATFIEARRVAKEYAYRMREKGRISFSDPEDNVLPSIHIVRRTLPEVWEDTTMALLGIGQEIHTHYDPMGADGEFNSFPSIEATAMMHIKEPFAEPRFHKHFLGGWH